MKNDYLEKILTARVYDVAVETPLEPAPNLSQRIHNRLLLKREDMQPVFSFKLRGAYNKMANLPPAVLKRGVIAASAGNHAQGVALSAQKLNCRATIVMPVTTPAIKVQAVEARGAQVVLHGDSYDEACARAVELAGAERLAFVHPYDDPEVIAGQGTIGMEILRQHPRPIHAVFVPIGGGGLISGIAAYVKRLRPEVKVIGVEPTDADAMARSLKAGHRVRLSQVGLFADGVAVKQVGEETFRLCKELVDEVMLVDTDATCAAIKDVFEDTCSILSRRRSPHAGANLRGAEKSATRPWWRWLPSQHELRPPALRGRAGGGGGAARGGAGGDAAGTARRLPEIHFPHRQTQHHRVQLPLRRFPRGARLRRHPGAQPRRVIEAGRVPQKARLSHHRSYRRRAGQTAHSLPGGRPCAANRQRSDPSLRISGASRGADEFPQQHAP